MTIFDVVDPGVTRGGDAFYQGEQDGVLFKVYVLGTKDEVSGELSRVRGLKKRLEGPR